MNKLGLVQVNDRQQPILLICISGIEPENNPNPCVFLQPVCAEDGYGPDDCQRLGSPQGSSVRRPINNPSYNKRRRTILFNAKHL